MDSVIQAGLAIVVGFQSLGDGLRGTMQFFSFLGSENFFLFVLPLVYWCLDAGLGVRIGMILLFSNQLNSLCKLALHGPRPYWYSADVQGMASETSFGIPSGHAQNAVAIWGTFARRLERTWGWVAAMTLALLIGLSRIYLGVHFPHDVLFGWLLGGLLLWAVAKFWNPVVARLKQISLAKQLLLAFGLSIALLLISWLMTWAARDFVLPAEWIVNATRNGGEAPDPFTLEGPVSSVATLFGFLAGLAWIASRGGYRVSGSAANRALRFAIGLLGVLIFYLGLKTIFPVGSDPLALALRYVRYGLVGFWISGGAPWVFSKFRLAGG